MEAIADWTPIDEAKLENHKMIVHKNKGAVILVARSLKAIKDERLWRKTHDSFEEFARDEFQFVRSHAYRLCEWVDVSDVVSPSGGKSPNERQARELARLESPKEQSEAWEETLSATAGEPTAAETKRVVDRKIGGTDPAERHKPASSGKAKKQPAFDYYAHADSGLDKCQEGMDEMTDPAEFSKLATRLYALYEMAEARAVYEKELKA